MSLDLIDMSDDVFDEWLQKISGLNPGDDLTEERLVILVSTTLRELKPEARARGLVALANLCYAMAVKTLGAQHPVTKCLEIVVSATQRH